MNCQTVYSTFSENLLKTIPMITAEYTVLLCCSGPYKDIIHQILFASGYAWVIILILYTV